MGHYPPADVRRQLRAEVGRVCPVAGCGSRYLTYHHFDPPWRDREHHEPEGMIALCLQHHAEADVGTYTIAQLRAMKVANRVHTSVDGVFNWRRERTIFKGGSNFFLDCPIILQVRQRDIIWLTKSEEGFDLFNLDLFAPDGKLVFSMRDNEWTAVPSLDDIEAPPSARRLSSRSRQHGIALDLQFRDLSPTEFQQISREPAPEGPCLLCEMNGSVAWPIAVQFGCLVSGCGVAFAIT
jgi:hypothetical protein